MDLNQDKKISLQQLKEFLMTAKSNELDYIIGCFGGPGNTILREKYFEHSAAKALTRLVLNDIANREIDRILSE